MGPATTDPTHARTSQTLSAGSELAAGSAPVAWALSSAAERGPSGDGGSAPVPKWFSGIEKRMPARACQSSEDEVSSGSTTATLPVGIAAEETAEAKSAGTAGR